MSENKDNFISKSNTESAKTLREAGEAKPASERARDFAGVVKKRWSASKKARANFRLKPKFVFIFLAVVCFTLIILSVAIPEVAVPFKSAASYVIEPAQNGINKLGLWISDKIALFKSISELQDENESLQNEIERLVSVNESLKQNENELNRVRDLLDLKELYSEYDAVAAQVVARDSSGWFSTFTINKGSADGIEPDMNIIANGALIGIVTDVGINYSMVRAVISDLSNVSAEFQDSGGLCTVTGNLKLMENNLIEFSQVDASVEINLNETIVTSHISSKYLPGLIIGYVASFELDANELTKSGYLTPAADFTNLKEVLIIKTLKKTWD